MLKKTLAALAIGTALLSAGQVMAADYVVDKEGQHAFVDFKISHLGYSFITGTFKDLDGKFSFDAAKLSGQIVVIDAAYVDQRLQVLSQDEDLSRFIL